MGKLDMTWDEMKRRISNGASVKVLAELNGVSYQTIYNFMKKNKEAEAGLPEPEYIVGHHDKSPKLLVDKDVYEEIEQFLYKINEAISDHERKLDELANKRTQFEKVLDLLGVRE